MLLIFRYFLNAHALELIQAGPGICSGFLPATNHQQIYQAIVCGVPLPSGQTKQLFLDSGLIHIMVVSGAHLAVLETLIQRLNRRAVRPFLIFYSFMTGLQPPVVRALVRRLLLPAARNELGCSSIQIELLTSVVILVLYPPWLMSRSFLMSWMCGLAIALPLPISFAAIPIKCYVFLLPFCWMTPVTIGWNLLLEPAIALFLFPLSLAVVVLPPLHLVGDWGWSFLLRILSLGPVAERGDLVFATASLAGFAIFVQLLLICGEIQWRRASAFSYS